MTFKHLRSSLLALFVSGFLASSPAQAPAAHEVDLGIIVVPTQDQANKLLDKLHQGWDFGVLAKENSLDPSGNDGGYFGRLAPDQLREPIKEVASTLQAGQFSGVVQTPSGYAILTVFAQPPKKSQTDLGKLNDMARAGVALAGLEVGGFAEAEAAFRQFPKPEGWERDLQQICSIRKQSYASAVDKVKQRLAQLEADHVEAKPLDLLRMHNALGQLYAYMGVMPDAASQFEAALKISQTDAPGGSAHFEEALGALYLHWAEVENEGYRAPGENDLFPPRSPSTHYKVPDKAKKAVEYLTRSLVQLPNDYQARWLLNLAYTTMGQYPDGVPAKYLIPLSAFESPENIGRFRDIAPAAGLDVFMGAGGVLVEDFENNGLLDVIVTSWDVCQSPHYFHNNGDGTFSDRTQQAGLSDQLGGLNLVEADYNNDGCTDFLVLRGGWEWPMRKSLLRNNCNGTFTDVTDASGLGASVTQTQSAAFADIDNDGNLDLFLANENTPAQLFHNRGDGTFEDISHAAGVDQVAFSKGVTAADYDNDGYVDFYVSNQGGPNFLYRNNHDKTFTEIAAQAGVQEPLFSFSTWFFDYDNDGWPDLFVTSYYNSMEDPVRDYLHIPPHLESERLYRNLHNGTFEDVSAQVGLDRIFIPMGSSFGDFDNDGFLDIYLGMGNPSLGSLMPHELLRNDEGKKFVDITASSGTGELHKGHAIALADLRRNGQLDIVANMGGAIPADKHAVRLFQNPGSGNDWINVKLVGVKSNRSAIGARIHVTVEDANGHPRSIWRTVGEISSFGAAPLEQHIGLGPNAKNVSLDVWWPATDSRQHFSNVPARQFIQIAEFAPSFTLLDRKPLPTLGTSR